MAKSKEFRTKLIIIVIVVLILYGVVGAFFPTKIPEGVEISLITLKDNEVENIIVNDQTLNFENQLELTTVIDMLNNLTVVKEEVIKKDEVMQVVIDFIKIKDIEITFGQNYVQNGEKLFSIEEEQVEDLYNLMANYS